MMGWACPRLHYLSSGGYKKPHVQHTVAALPSGRPVLETVGLTFSDRDRHRLEHTARELGGAVTIPQVFQYFQLHSLPQYVQECIVNWAAGAYHPPTDLHEPARCSVCNFEPYLQFFSLMGPCNSISGWEGDGGCTGHVCHAPPPPGYNMYPGPP